MAHMHCSKVWKRDRDGGREGWREGREAGVGGWSRDIIRILYYIMTSSIHSPHPSGKQCTVDCSIDTASALLTVSTLTLGCFHALFLALAVSTLTLGCFHALFLALAVAGQRDHSPRPEGSGGTFGTQKDFQRDSGGTPPSGRGDFWDPGGLSEGLERHLSPRAGGTREGL